MGVTSADRASNSMGHGQTHIAEGGRRAKNGPRVRAAKDEVISVDPLHIIRTSILGLYPIML
jgi:hypothetical protein